MVCHRAVRARYPSHRHCYQTPAFERTAAGLSADVTTQSALVDCRGVQKCRPWSCITIHRSNEVLQGHDNRQGCPNRDKRAVKIRRKINWDYYKARESHEISKKCECRDASGQSCVQLHAELSLLKNQAITPLCVCSLFCADERRGKLSVGETLLRVHTDNHGYCG